MVDPVAKPTVVQTWAANAKDIVTSIANWMLVECVAAKTRWNSLTDGDGLVLRGHELATAAAEHRGIPLGTMTLTPGELLKAMQDQAVASNAPTHPLPVGPEPVVTSGETSATTSATAAVHEESSGGTTAPLTDWQKADLTEVQWNALTEEQRAESRRAHP